MPYTPLVVDRFSGLNLYDDPQEIGASSAVDISNVDIDNRGRIRARDGSSAVSASAAANPTTQLAYYKDASNVEWIVGHDNAVLRPIKISDGSAGTTQAGTVTSNNAFARFGDPSNTRLYAAASGTLYRFNGTAWASVGGLPISPNLVAVTANDNRLAIATGSSSRIHFSNAGVPETFTYAAGPPETGDFIDLWPGDGEVITALIRWRDYLFAFKQSKFAVFTGTGTNSAGQPVFNYHAVDVGHGVYAAGLAAAGDEGVYFSDGRTIYLTTGEAPLDISRPIEPLLKLGVGVPGTSLPTFLLASASLTYHNRRLYGIYPNGASSSAVIYDRVQDQWLVSQFGALCAASVPVSWGPYFGEFTSKKIARVDSSATTDLGSAFSWYYKSGFYGEPFRQTIGWTDVSGVGTVTLQVLTQSASPNSTADPGSSVVLGTSPTVATTRRRRAVTGRMFAHMLSGSGAATVSRLVQYTGSGRMV